MKELKQDSYNLKTENDELKMRLHEENEEKKILLLQQQAKEEAFEKLHRYLCELKSSSRSSCMFPDDDFVVFENHTT